MRLAWTLAFVLALGVTAPAPSYAQAPREVAPPLRTAGLGTNLSLASGLSVPPEGGRLGAPLALELQHGLAFGPAIFAPGVRVVSMFVPGAVGLAGLAELRFTVPMVQLAPYIALGAGPGYRTVPAQLGFAFQAGPGLMVAVSERLTVGVEASYFQIVGSHFRRLSFGPSLSFGL